MTGVRTGLDRVADGDSKATRLIAGRKVGLLAHAASVDRALRPAATVLEAAGGRLRALFGPEHGFAGAAQDMMGVGSQDQADVPVYSLYGDDAADLSPNPDQSPRKHTEDSNRVNDCAVFFRVLPWRMGGQWGRHDVSAIPLTPSV